MPNSRNDFFHFTASVLFNELSYSTLFLKLYWIIIPYNVVKVNHLVIQLIFSPLRDRKNWSEWTNLAKGVYRYSAGDGLFAVKRHKKENIASKKMQYSPLIIILFIFAFLRSGRFLHHVNIISERERPYHQ